MNLVAFIQARETSTRFPGKINADLGNLTVLHWVYSAAERIKNVTSIKILRPTQFPDIPENDVLSRFWGGYQDWCQQYDGIVRLTADCPFLDPAVCNLVVDEFARFPCDYASNVWPKRTWPDGLDCEIFTPEILKEASLKAISPSDREHVTSWMQRNSVYRSVELPVDWSWVRLTVDTEEDLAWLRQCLAAPRS